ncbi:MAG: glycosyltransferase family 4 protein [Bacteroidales bacterium]|nr:glycosyltransferase family 4 protein [Bacteroidales bacterium]
MRLIIVAPEPYPNGMAGTKRVTCYARAMLSAGIDCEVVLFRRTEKRGKARNTASKGVFQGVPYRYIGGSPYKGNHYVTRKFFNWLDAKLTERYLRKNLHKGDVLFLYMGQQLDLMLRFMNAAKSVGAFCVRDLCEIPYGTSVETEETAHMRKRVLNEQFPLLDGVISISDPLLELAKKWTRPDCKHIKVPILVDYEEFNLPDKSMDQEVPYIFHSGTLFEQKDGILGMIEAFGKAWKDIPFPVKFVLSGSVEESPHKDEIIRLINQYDLDGKVIFTGYLNDCKLSEYLSGATLTIINKYPTLQNRYGFSTKLGEYLAAGKPVIITRFGEAMNWLEDGKSAYIIDLEDNDALARAIVRVFMNQEERKKVSEGARALCHGSFDYSIWGDPLLGFLNSLGK